MNYPERARSKSQTYVQVAVPIPGYAAPWVFKLKLLLLEITVQLYFWSVPPAGRGSGRAYSLIEAALCQEPASKPQVKVALDPVSKSPLLENLLARCEPIASAVICAHLLPRFTGFPNRVILEEGQAVVAKAKEDDTWQQNARRAGWQPRAEAAVEKAVSEMFVEAGGFAYEAMASTAAGAIQILESPADAASAMAGAAYGSASSAARMLKSSFGMEG
ncbi:unnamed protein product [Effrenium voratum]|nr:unnamed protein product [Effrenium voratum]